MLFFIPFIRPLARLNDELRDPLCKNRFGKSIALTLGQSALVGAGLVTTGIVVGGASSVAYGGHGQEQGYCCLLLQFCSSQRL